MVNEELIRRCREEITPDTPAGIIEHSLTGEAYIIHADTIHGVSEKDLKACEWCSKIIPDSELMKQILRLRYRIN
jgi:hypothetical protein